MRLQSVALAAALACACVASRAQTANGQGSRMPVIRTETKLVLVDTVVVDKKGNYIRDLESKNFKVWEDNKEQPIQTFSFEADASAPARSRHRYLVLFFDNSTMDFAIQAQARQAAAKFIDANAGTDRLMAVVNFGGALRVAQNFTADAERLKAAVNRTGFSTVSPNEPVQVTSVGMPRLGGMAEFGARTMLLAVRELAKNLSNLPGRKIVVLFSAGFPVTPEVYAEVRAAIDACNKANVAVYPIDARGLTTPMGAALPPAFTGRMGIAMAVYPALQMASFLAFEPQRGGAGQTGGGGAPSGGRGGSTGGGSTGAAGGGGRGPVMGGGAGGTTRGGAGGRTMGTGGNPGGSMGGRGGYGGAANPNIRQNVPPQYRNTYPNLGRRDIIPPFPSSATVNQQVLYQLADGTGGFVIVNTNDLLGGLQKIGREQNEYYVLGYTPPESTEGSCHQLKVKVDRGGTVVRARSGYCDVKQADVLAGKPAEKQLELHAAAAETGTVAAPMQLPYFYTATNRARVSVAMEIPSQALKFEKLKGKMHAEMNILGIAYKPDESVAARFSDTVKLDFDGKHEVEEFQKKPFHYENQFEIASGKYNFKAVFSSGGEGFGKVEKPLVVDEFNNALFGIGGLALSGDIHGVTDAEAALDAVLLEDRVPLVTMGLQFTPSGSNRFKKGDPAGLYTEVYEPALAGEKPPQVYVTMKVVDRKTGETKLDAGMVPVAKYVRAGNPVIPVGLKLPLEQMDPGAYRVEVRAVDSAGLFTITRSADFDVR